ncbi:hypothetical protein TNCV_1235351 [Trichonephila clavipes]|nr:hypothetical protein TNCV_1235351 [Trichonephila clavipes]
MENIRKRVDIRLCNNGEKAEKLISKPNFKDRTIFCENLTAFHMGKTSLTLNKPIAKFVNFPSLYPSKNPDIMETVDTKQENYQNQFTDTVEDKINTLTSLSPKEHVTTRPKKETSVDTIEEEIGSIALVKCKNIPNKILNFIQKNQGEIYWTPDKELIVDGKIIRNTNIINLIIHLCTWSIFIPHLPEPTGPAEILLIVDGLQTFDMLHSSTGNFLLIVDGLHTFDVLPSSIGNFPLIVDGLQSFDVLSRRSA